MFWPQWWTLTKALLISLSRSSFTRLCPMVIFSTAVGFLCPLRLRRKGLPSVFQGCAALTDMWSHWWRSWKMQEQREGKECLTFCFLSSLMSSFTSLLCYSQPMARRGNSRETRAFSCACFLICYLKSVGVLRSVRVSYFPYKLTCCGNLLRAIILKRHLPPHSMFNLLL